MPVEYAARKFGNALALVAVPPVVPADPDVVVFLLPPPPHAAAMSETPAAKDAAVTSHFRGCVPVKSLPPQSRMSSARREDDTFGATAHSY
jgi:hypothetical protein